MKCPVCGATELVRDTRDIPYALGDKTVSIPRVTGDFCPACGEVVLDKLHGDRYARLTALVRRGQPLPDGLAQADMIAQCDLNAPPPAGLRSWDEMPAIGREAL